MTIARVKPADWAVNEKLTSAQMNAVDTNITFTLDKRAGEIDTLSSNIHVASGGSITFESGSGFVLNPGTTAVVDCTLICTDASIVDFRGMFVADSGSIFTLAGTNVFNGTTTIGGTCEIGGTPTITASSINWNVAGNPVFGCTNTAVNGVTAQQFNINGQNATGLLTTGGNIIINAGSGTLLDGSVKIRSDNNQIALFNPNDISILRPLTASASSIVSATQSYAYAATVAVDFSLGNSIEITTALTGNLLINTSNIVDGGIYTLYVVQDGTGGRTVSFNVSAFSGNTTAVVTTAGTVNIFTYLGKITGGVSRLLRLACISY